MFQELPERPRVSFDWTGHPYHVYEKCMFVYKRRIYHSVNYSSEIIPTDHDCTAEPNCFMRFGYLPEGRSMNHHTEEFEKGVSVFHAIRFDNGVVLPIVRDLTDVEEDRFTYMETAERPAFLVIGTLLDDSGSDGEPLLDGAKVRGVLRTILVEQGVIAWAVDQEYRETKRRPEILETVQT